MELSKIICALTICNCLISSSIAMDNKDNIWDNLSVGGYNSINIAHTSNINNESFIISKCNDICVLPSSNNKQNQFTINPCNDICILPQNNNINPTVDPALNDQQNIKQQDNSNNNDVNEEEEEEEDGEEEEKEDKNPFNIFKALLNKISPNKELNKEKDENLDKSNKEDDKENPFDIFKALLPKTSTDKEPDKEKDENSDKNNKEDNNENPFDIFKALLDNMISDNEEDENSDKNNKEDENSDKNNKEDIGDDPLYILKELTFLKTVEVKLNDAFDSKKFKIMKDCNRFLVKENIDKVQAKFGVEKQILDAYKKCHKQIFNSCNNLLGRQLKDMPGAIANIQTMLRGLLMKFYNKFYNKIQEKNGKYYDEKIPLGKLKAKFLNENIESEKDLHGVNILKILANFCVVFYEICEQSQSALHQALLSGMKNLKYFSEATANIHRFCTMLNVLEY